MKSYTRKIALFALFTALAFVFSYLESLVPLGTIVPGFKLGIANIVVVTAMYLLSEKQALAISLIRIVLAGLTFGGVFSLVYSLAGGLLSFGVMALARRYRGLSVTGVSMLGGAAHNIGQTAAAAAVMETAGIFAYLPVLLLAGAATGAVIGILCGIIINRLQKVIK